MNTIKIYEDVYKNLKILTNHIENLEKQKMEMVHLSKFMLQNLEEIKTNINKKNKSYIIIKFMINRIKDDLIQIQ